jgi:hypothetical protein
VKDGKAAALQGAVQRDKQFRAIEGRQQDGAGSTLAAPCRHYHHWHLRKLLLGQRKQYDAMRFVPQLTKQEVEPFARLQQGTGLPCQN